MSEYSFGTIAFYALFFGEAIFGIGMIVLLHVMHFILTRKFDSLLFKEPYFRKNELFVYTIWPFSLIRTIGYMLFLVFPDYVKRKRFKDVELNLDRGSALVFFSQLFLFVVVVESLLVLAMIGWGLVEMVLSLIRLQ